MLHHLHVNEGHTFSLGVKWIQCKWVFLWELNGSSVSESGYRSLQRLIYGLPISSLDLGKKKLPSSAKKNPCSTWCNLSLSIRWKGRGSEMLLQNQDSQGQQEGQQQPSWQISGMFHVSSLYSLCGGNAQGELELGQRGHHKKKKRSSSFIQEHTSVLCKP